MEGAARKSDLENDVTRKVNQILLNILFFLFITLRPPTSFFFTFEFVSADTITFVRERINVSIENDTALGQSAAAEPLHSKMRRKMREGRPLSHGQPLRHYNRALCFHLVLRNCSQNNFSFLRRTWRNLDGA